jgi:predicted NAD/FAD-binding protein
MGARHSKGAAKIKKRVCIVGGGAAGMACAWSLARFPDKFDVTVLETLPEVGGVASTCAIAGSAGAANAELDEINDQVQGGAPSYRNNLLFFQQFGFEPHEVDFKIAFGTGEHAWSNHGGDSELVRRLAPDIERFGRALKWVYRLEPIFIFLPIDAVLRLWGFSDDFCTRMVYPLTALFFGTGNRQPSVSAAVVARVFLDPQLRLFQYSPKRLLDEVPKMFAFPKLGPIFAAIASRISATVLCNATVEAVERLRGGKVRVRCGSLPGGGAEFDDVVFACGAESALRMLGRGGSWLERRLLRNVRYYNDLIVTHEDEAYMARHYQFDPREDMYFIRCDPEEPRRVEMSFNLTAYQPHLQGKRTIFQSIFLDDSQRQHWTDGELDPGKVLKKRMTHQFAHTWRHFAFWVVLASWIQGRRGVWYAGAYTLFNTHEIACMSGLAAAERLGAPYPFAHDALATQQFDTYLKLAHGVFVRRRRG